MKEPSPRQLANNIKWVERFLERKKLKEKEAMKNRTYDILKYTALIALPALQVAWISISGIWGLPLGEEISLTIGAVNALLGALVGVSAYQHNKQS